MGPRPGSPQKPVHGGDSLEWNARRELRPARPSVWIKAREVSPSYVHFTSAQLCRKCKNMRVKTGQTVCGAHSHELCVRSPILSAACPLSRSRLLRWKVRDISLCTNAFVRSNSIGLHSYLQFNGCLLPCTNLSRTRYIENVKSFMCYRYPVSSLQGNMPIMVFMSGSASLKYS